MEDYEDFGATEEQYAFYQDAEFAIPVEYELIPLVGVRVEVNGEFPAMQLLTKTYQQVWLILTSKMQQREVNRAIVCAKACLPINSRIEHLRGMLRRMDVFPESKERIPNVISTYSIKGACYSFWEFEGRLCFSRFLTVTVDYKVEIQINAPEEVVVPLQEVVPEVFERVSEYHEGYFGEVRLMDLGKSRSIIEMGLTNEEKKVVSCWFEAHVLRLDGFERKGELVTAEQYLEVMKQHFGLVVMRQPWYFNVPLFITDKMPVIVTCGCDCHLMHKDHEDDLDCHWCHGGKPRLERALIDSVGREESFHVKLDEHWSAHSMLSMEVEVLEGQTVEVQMYYRLRLQRAGDVLKVCVYDRAGNKICSDGYEWPGRILPQCLEVISEGDLPVMSLTNQPQWMNYIITMGWRKRSPLPFKLPHMVEVTEWNGYSGNALFFSVGDNFRYIEKNSSEEFVAVDRVAVSLVRRASHFAIGIFLRDVFLIKRLIGVDVFSRLLMRDVWGITGLYFADLMFPAGNFVYSASLHHRYRSLMAPSLPICRVPKWLGMLLMFTCLNNDVLKVLLFFLERYPVEKIEWYDEYDFSPLDYASCFYEEQVRQRVRLERQRGLIRSVTRVDKRSAYEKKRLAYLSREPVARSVEELRADPTSVFHDQAEMEEQARLLHYCVAAVSVGE